jgi:hypothetical protein
VLLRTSLDTSTNQCLVKVDEMAVPGCDIGPGRCASRPEEPADLSR